MTTAFTMAMFAVAVSLGAVFISIRSSKASAAKRHGDSDSDSGTTIMASDGGADCSPGDGGGSDAGCDSGCGGD